MARIGLRALARSSSFAGIASLWQVGVGILLTPLILGRITLEGYGVWMLLHSLAMPLNVVGMSFGLAYAKYAAEAQVRDEPERLRELLGSGTALVGGLASLAVGVLWFVREPVLALAGVPDALRHDAGLALVLVGLTLVAQMSLGSVRSVLAGLQRVDLQYKSVILSSLVYVVCAVASLHEGLGLLGLGLSFLAGELLSIGVAWLWCRRLYPGFGISPWRATRSGIREVVALGGRFQLLNVLMDVTNAAFRWFLSGTLGPASLGIYEIARKLARLSETGARSILAPMMPAFANLHAAGDAESVRRVHEHGSRLLLVVSVASFGFTATFADRAILLWTGQSYPLAVWTLRVLAAAFVVKQITGMGSASLRSRGKVGLELAGSAIGVTLRVLLLIPLFWIWRYEGFVVAASLSAISGSLWFAAAICRAEGVPAAGFLGRVLVRPLVAVAPVCALFFLLGARLHLGLPGLGVRWAALAELTLWAAAWLPVLAATAWFGVLSRAERASLAQAIRARLPAGRGRPFEDGAHP